MDQVTNAPTDPQGSNESSAAADSAVTRLHAKAFGTGLTTWMLLNQLDWAAERIERAWESAPVDAVESDRIAEAAAAIVARLSTIAGSAEPAAGNLTEVSERTSPQATDGQLEALDQLIATLTERPGVGDLGQEVDAALTLATTTARWARRLAYAEAGVSMRPEYIRRRRAGRTAA